jgi:hypothetical protein
MPTIMFDLPDSTYQNWKQKAETSNSTIEDMMREWAIISSPKPEDDDSISPELQRKLDAIAVFDTKILKQQLAKTFPRRKSKRVENLLFKRGKEGLSEQEQAELKQIISEQDDFMLIRAEIMDVLGKRGENVKELIKKKK